MTEHLQYPKHHKNTFLLIWKSVRKIIEKNQGYDYNNINTTTFDDLDLNDKLLRGVYAMGLKNQV